MDFRVKKVTIKKKSACTIRAIVNLCTKKKKKNGGLLFPTSTYGKTPSSGTKLISQGNSRAHKDTHQTPTGQYWANSLYTPLLAGHSRHLLSFFFFSFPDKKSPHWLFHRSSQHNVSAREIGACNSLQQRPALGGCQASLRGNHTSFSQIS